MMLYKITVRSVIEYGRVCYSGMSNRHMRRLERIQWIPGQICFGLMRSTHVLSDPLERSPSNETEVSAF
jgi:hypothetical protein